MKKSILMAIVALALLAAPAFAGEFGHQIVLDAGFGMALSPDVDSYAALTDGATRFGVSGTLDDNNSIYIMWDMGGIDIENDVAGSQIGNLGQFESTTNVLGAFGLTDVPVTLSLTQGYGRLELHNRFNQWTGWEWTTRKDQGDPKVYAREYYISLTTTIMNMVNVKIGFNPDFDEASGVGFLMDVWTSVAAGPVNLDISAFLVNHAAGQSQSWYHGNRAVMNFGGEVQANMNLGPVALMAALVDVVDKDEADDGIVNHLMVAVKPTMAAGPATIGLGIWFDATTDTNLDEDATTMSTAIDLSASIAMITLFGGVRINRLNLTDAQKALDLSMTDFMIWEMGATVGMGATSVTVGINGGKAAFNAGGGTGAAGDMRAVDNTVGLSTDPDATTCMYVKFSTQMW